MTKIYVMTHKRFQAPADETYVPLQVGKAGREDLGYLGDDTGDNISALNCFYGELTGFYWLWKNVTSDDNIGICHYRRYFINEDRRILREADYENILKDYDLIVSKAIYQDESYRKIYAKAHYASDLEQLEEVVKEMYPADYPVLEEVFSGTKNYFGNLMVAPGQLFREYCAWLFPIFEDLAPRLDLTSYDEYNRRIYGFLSEELLLVWVKARGLKAYECPVGVTGSKAETIELKLAVGQLLKMDRLDEAVRLFYEVLKVRPDISLENSDLSGDIPDMQQILHICKQEALRGEKGMLAYSTNIDELLKYYRAMKQR